VYCDLAGWSIDVRGQPYRETQDVQFVGQETYVNHVGILALLTALTLVFGIVGMTTVTADDAQRGNMPLFNGSEFRYIVGGGYYSRPQGNDRGSMHEPPVGDDDHNGGAGNAASNNGRGGTQAGPNDADHAYMVTSGVLCPDHQ